MNLQPVIPQDLRTTASPTFANITDSGLTITRIPYASTAGLLIDDAALTFTTATGNLAATSFNSVYIKTVADYNYSLGDATTMEDLEGGAQYNTCFGYQDGINITTGDKNTFIGSVCGGGVVLGSWNVAIGYHALSGLTGDSNIAIGTNALGDGIGSAGGLIAIGTNAGRAVTEAVSSIFIGSNAGQKVTVGTRNLIIGGSAAIVLVDGNYNIMIGQDSGNASVSDSYNTFIGFRAAYKTNGGSYNTFISASSGRENTTGGYNNYIGYEAGNKNQTGGHNTLSGHQVGNGTATLSNYANNVFIGYQAGLLARTATSDCIFIGNLAGSTQTAIGSLLIVDNQARANPAAEATDAILYGVMAATPASQTLAINADTTITRDLRFTTSLDSAAVADEVSLGCYELSAGNRALAISQESAVAAETDETKFSHKLPVRINGSTYYIMLTAT